MLLASYVIGHPLGMRRYFRPMSADDPNDFNAFGNPFAKFFGGQDFNAIMADMQSMFESHDGPVNVKRARAVAHEGVKADDSLVSPSDEAAVKDAFTLADQWLDAATDLPAVAITGQAWNRGQWVDGTIESWATLIGPITIRTNKSLEAVMPEEMRQKAQPVIAMINQISGSLVGQQIGTGVALLAKEVMSSTDVGLPMAPEHVGALLPKHLRKFAAELDIPLTDTFLFFALRELAHIRLFDHAPWLMNQITTAMLDTSEATVPDYSAIESIATENPQLLLNFDIEDYLTPESRVARDAALERLETLLALIEGWVDNVVEQAAGEKLASFAKLSEAMRRRRTAGGPAEEAFGAMVGLEFGPKRLREASRLWLTIKARKGQSARDEVWSHPDWLPTSADLADPLGYGEADELDQQIAQLLEEDQRPNE